MSLLLQEEFGPDRLAEVEESDAGDVQAQSDPSVCQDTVKPGAHVTAGMAVKEQEQLQPRLQQHPKLSSEQTDISNAPTLPATETETEANTTASQTQIENASTTGKDLPDTAAIGATQLDQGSGSAPMSVDVAGGCDGDGDGRNGGGLKKVLDGSGSGAQVQVHARETQEIPESAIKTTAETDAAAVDVQVNSDAAESSAKELQPQPKSGAAAEVRSPTRSPSLTPTSTPAAVLSAASSRTRDPKVVTSLEESFLFEEYCFDTIVNVEGGEEKVVDIWEAMESDTFSTAFSGIEASTVGMNQLRLAWCKKLGIPFQRQPVSYQIEWNKDCISEFLPLSKKHGTCLFTNIAAFYRDELQETIHHLFEHPAMAVEVLAPLISSNKAMKLSAWCETHGKVCTLQSCKRHIAGTSCKPWSRKGANMGAADPEIIFTLAWIGLRVALEDFEVLSENVKSSGACISASDEPQHVQDAGLGNLLLRFLSPYYFMETILLNPGLIGDPFSRDREFVKMVHKRKALSVVSPMSRFCKRFFRMCQWSWKSTGLSYLSSFVNLNPMSNGKSHYDTPLRSYAI